MFSIADLSVFRVSILFLEISEFFVWQDMISASDYEED